MGNAIQLNTCPMRGTATAHDHQILVILLLCPEEHCRKRAIALLEDGTVLKSGADVLTSPPRGSRNEKRLSVLTAGQ
jgi:hypothetical protein